MSDVTPEQAANTIRSLTALLADHAEMEMGGAHVDQVRADILAALDSLVTALTAAERKVADYAEVIDLLGDDLRDARTRADAAERWVPKPNEQGLTDLRSAEYLARDLDETRERLVAATARADTLTQRLSLISRWLSSEQTAGLQIPAPIQDAASGVIESPTKRGAVSERVTTEAPEAAALPPEQDTPPIGVLGCRCSGNATADGIIIDSSHCPVHAAPAAGGS